MKSKRRLAAEGRSPKQRKMKVLIVEDHPMTRDGIRCCIEKEPWMRIVDEVGSVRDAVDAATKSRPDIVLMDILLPDGSGVDATKEILKNVPGARVLALSAFHERETVQKMEQAGAVGFVGKDSMGSELLDALKALSTGQTYYSRSITESAMAEYLRVGRGGSPGAVALTAEERRLLTMIVGGDTAKTIGQAMGRSAKTVLARRQQLMRKMGVDSVASLVAKAVRGELA